jgi:hypothetical protein
VQVKVTLSHFVSISKCCVCSASFKLIVGNITEIFILLRLCAERSIELPLVKVNPYINYILQREIRMYEFIVPRLFEEKRGI